jgi:hypothetical protein
VARAAPVKKLGGNEKKECQKFFLGGEVMPENWGGDAPDLRSIFGGIDATA